MMRDAFNRRLPPLAYRNSIERLFGVVTEPTDNIAWFDSIGDRLAKATAEMNAERENDRLAQQLEQVRRCDEQEQERQIRREMREFTEWTGLGI